MLLHFRKMLVGKDHGIEPPRLREVYRIVLEANLRALAAVRPGTTCEQVDRVARRVIEIFRRIRPTAREEHDLTPREQRILKLLVEGHNYRTAAAELAVSVNTIAFHVKRIHEKLHVHSKSEAVAKALKSGLV